MTAIIVCNGSVCDYTYYKKYFSESGFVICVDGGASHVRTFGVKPDVLLGDFDSIKSEDFEYFKNLKVEILEFPREKDMTDTELAVELAVKRGCEKVIFIGGLGTRIDHSLSNIFILKQLIDKGIKGVIVNEHNEITLIDESIQIKKEEGIKLTLLPLSQRVSGITTKGLYYPLKDAVLEMGSTMGISNEFVEDEAEITVESGLLLVIKSKD